MAGTRDHTGVGSGNVGPADPSCPVTHLGCVGDVHEVALKANFPVFLDREVLEDTQVQPAVTAALDDVSPGIAKAADPGLWPYEARNIPVSLDGA